MTTTSRCAIEWITIPAPDLEAARRFYSGVFGFTVDDYSDRFLVFHAANLQGGLDRDLEPAGQGIGFSVTVPSVHTHLEAIRQAGCEIVREPYELGPGAGWCARFRDPCGNLLELYSASA